jgi:hypothetical protein
MRVTITDREGVALETIEDDDPMTLAGLLPAALLRWHAIMACQTFGFRLEGDPTGHLCRITCTTCKVSQEQVIEPWFVGAAALAFHTSHEGHPLHIEYNGRVIESPKRKPRVHVPGETPQRPSNQRSTKRSRAPDEPAQKKFPKPNEKLDPISARLTKRFSGSVEPLEKKLQESRRLFIAEATPEWATALINDDSITVDSVEVWPDDDRSGHTEDGRFVLAMHIVLRATHSRRPRKYQFEWYEISVPR